MRLLFSFLCVFLACQLGVTAELKESWVTQSNKYTQRLLAIEFKHSPEQGSQSGLSEFDKLISNPSVEDEHLERKELKDVLGQLQKEGSKETDTRIRQDLAIIQDAFSLRFTVEDYHEDHMVPFFNASQLVFMGLHTLLDEQVAPERRPAALDRIRKYAGLEKGYKPICDIFKERTTTQMSKANMHYPSKGEIETELSRNSNYIDGIAALIKKYAIAGGQEAFESLKQQLIQYDTWVRTELLPKATTDFRLPKELYSLNFKTFGIDISPDTLAQKAHNAFKEIQDQMQKVAARVAAKFGYASSDYRNVITELKKKQITGDKVLPFFESRLHDLEKISRDQRLVSLPRRPAVIRIASAAETAQQPAPHMQGPPMVHNTGERGEFVLPLNVPSELGKAADQYDDFTYDAAAWTLTAHEARPGHELQFDSMVEHGISLARALYAFNSVNVEGWGLYSEYIVQPFEPDEGQLITLQFRLLRAARAFLDPELQEGKITAQRALEVLQKDVMLSHAFATEEVERFTYRMPGQACSYFYGYSRLLELRGDTEKLMGPKFDQMKFHDFILSQGLLPPDLLRKSVMQDFAKRS